MKYFIILFCLELQACEEGEVVAWLTNQYRSRRVEKVEVFLLSSVPFQPKNLKQKNIAIDCLSMTVPYTIALKHLTQFFLQLLYKN